MTFELTGAGQIVAVDNGKESSMSLCRLRIAGSVALIGFLLAISATALAQNSRPGGYSQDNSHLNGSISHEDLEKLNANRKDETPAQAKVRSDSAALLVALQINCMVSNVALVVSGTLKPKTGGKDLPANIYEVACKDDMGYLLMSQGSDPPIGVSCLHAEDAREADVAKGAKPGYLCTLPENKDVYAWVAGLIQSGKGAACTVKQLQWFGQSKGSLTEYSEVACKEGDGYLVQTPQTGSHNPITVMSCAEAAKRGLKCKLTDAGPVETPLTADSFRASLAQNGVSCKIEQIQIMGQEQTRKRYVIEYRCAEHTESSVALIPAPGNTNPYETIDCAKAVQMGVICSFSK
ncbi:MAG TPA: hypothetical protein VK505_06095 [Steroidobacteraceae bacterium]|nr:hypothetical protein [Steroidobacteraceae bacterium]